MPTLKKRRKKKKKEEKNFLWGRDVTRFRCEGGGVVKRSQYRFVYIRITHPRRQNRRGGLISLFVLAMFLSIFRLYYLRFLTTLQFQCALNIG